MKFGAPPAGQPAFHAVSRRNDGGREHHYCHTREQAIAHNPFLIERLNRFGQVVSRERLA